LTFEDGTNTLSQNASKQFLTLRDEHRVRVFEKQHAEEGTWIYKGVTRECRKSHNEGLHDFCAPKNIIQVIKARTIS
jgi:hypothetical protein